MPLKIAAVESRALAGGGGGGSATGSAGKSRGGCLAAARIESRKRSSTDGRLAVAGADLPLPLPIGETGGATPEAPVAVRLRKARRGKTECVRVGWPEYSDAIDEDLLAVALLVRAELAPAIAVGGVRAAAAAARRFAW